jgi:hypothetical protein
VRRIAWKQLAVVLALALAVRLGAALYWQWRFGGQFVFGDSESYFALGKAIADGGPYEFGPTAARIFRTPGYPALLAPVYWLSHGPAAVMLARLESALLGMLVVAGVWWLARQLFDDRAAIIAAAIAAIYPEAIAASALVLSESPFCALMMLQFGLWAAAWKTDRASRAMLLASAAGATAGVATLVRPSWLLFTPAAIAIWWLSYLIKTSRSHGARPSSLILHPSSWMLCCLLAVLLPWWIRNARLTGHFVPTTLQVGASLYDGLNPQATGASDMRFVGDFVKAEERAQKDADTFEYRLDARMRKAATAWAWQHPGRAISLAGTKLLRMWNVWPNEPAFSSWPLRLLIFASYAPVLALGLLGAWKTIGRGWPYVLCWLPALYFTLLHTVFVSSIRYRLPAMLGLSVLAGGYVASKGDSPMFATMLRMVRRKSGQSPFPDHAEGQA